MIRLKNGGRAERAAIVTIMDSLSDLQKSTAGITALWDLVRVCRDHSFVITSDNSRKTLVRRGLIKHFNADGSAVVHDSIRDVVMSAVQGNGLNMRIVSPIA